MRGLYSSKTEIRHKVFTEIARMAYEEQSPKVWTGRIFREDV